MTMSNDDSSFDFLGLIKEMHARFSMAGDQLLEKRRGVCPRAMAEDVASGIRLMMNDRAQSAMCALLRALAESELAPTLIVDPYQKLIMISALTLAVDLSILEDKGVDLSDHLSAGLQS